MDAVTDPTVAEVWVMKSAQIGWTEILNNVIGYFIDQDPSPILLVQPTLELAEAWSKDRLAPMVRDTPALRGKIADARARDSGNTLLAKNFRGGQLTIAGANSPAGLASRPKRIALFDEVDRYPASAGAEGDPVALGTKRTQTFWNRKVLAGSTPTVKGSSRIEAGFEASDARFYFVPCPHCGEFQRLQWANVRWPEGRPDLAVYVCQHCGVELQESEKGQMLALGEWRASKSFNGRAGFHISELYSPWSTWAGMAAAFLEAKKLPETLQAFVNTAFGESYVEYAGKMEAKDLAARREPYTRNSLPAGVLLLTVGTDVQEDRIESTVYGWGADEEMFRVEHIVTKGDPASRALWAEHDEILRRRYPTDDGRELVIEAAAVDSGGHYTSTVYAYCSKRRLHRVWAIKGLGGQGKLAWPRKASRTKRGTVYMIGVDTIKDTIYQRLARVTAPGPGFIHFDADTDEEYFEQLTSEVRIYRIHQGRRVSIWRPKRTGGRQEALDCTVYAYAAMIGRGGSELLARRARRARGPALEPDDQAPRDPIEEPGAPAAAARPAPAASRAATPKPRPARPRAGWLNGWKR